MQRFGLALVFTGLALVLVSVGSLFAQGVNLGAVPAMMIAAAGLLLTSGMICLERGQPAVQHLQHQ